MAAFGTAGQQEKAQQLMLDGEKCLKKWTLFSSTTKNDDAAECFRGAGNCFKVRGEKSEKKLLFLRSSELCGFIWAF